MKGYRKILIAVNGSKEVLKQGLTLACDEKCWITVVKVLPPNEGDLNLTGVRNIEDVLSSSRRTEVSAMKKIADEEGVMIKTRLEEGDAFRQIVQAAEEEHCDVIVMGAKKRRT